MTGIWCFDTHVDVAPVDYVAKAIVHMALRGNPLGRAFHNRAVLSPDPAPEAEPKVAPGGTALPRPREPLPRSTPIDRLID
jgi:hypothetical protein